MTNINMHDLMMSGDHDVLLTIDGYDIIGNIHPTPHYEIYRHDSDHAEYHTEDTLDGVIAWISAQPRDVIPLVYTNGNNGVVTVAAHGLGITDPLSIQIAMIYANNIWDLWDTTGEDDDIRYALEDTDSITTTMGDDDTISDIQYENALRICRRLTYEDRQGRLVTYAD